MSKRRNIMLETLKEGRSFTWTQPDGGDLASMRAAIKHGQTLTLSPVRTPAEVQVGDIVYVKWHGGYILHKVQEIRNEEFLIVNSLGKINGWVSYDDILGRVTHIQEPEPRPDVPGILSQLEDAYRRLIERDQPAQDEAARLLSIVDDLRWYANRIGAERWHMLPQPNKWSFEQNLWHLTKSAQIAVAAETARPVLYFVDRGKACVGLAAALSAGFEFHETDWFL
jgi:hypothetical protein